MAYPNLCIDNGSYHYFISKMEIELHLASSLKLNYDMSFICSVIICWNYSDGVF